MKVKNYITLNGAEALRQEYHQLKNIERPKVVETVAWAAGNGDRSENGDYIYGKKRLREIDRRLRFLNKRLDSAEVIDPKTIQSQVVVFGATVTLEMESGETRTYQIVGEDEFDLKKNKLSWKSPLAKSLLGKKVGDEACIVKPKGEEWVEILEILFV